MSVRNKFYVRIKNNLVAAIATLAFTGTVNADNPIVYLDQGWTDQQRQAFYETPQGSYLIPLPWYLALEQADEDKLFSRRKNIKKFKYLVKGKSDTSALNVPIGFAVEPVADGADGDDWLGFTCASCHTNDIKFKDQRIRIDGAPALADFSGFVSALHNAVIATLDDDSKFERFAKRVVGTYDPTATSALHEALTNYAATSKAFQARNHTGLEYGYARLDAFGIIMNELFSDDMHVPENINEPNAPVSYPFIWGTPKHDWVQWNGSANNPLGRNVGEVIGTFGAVNLVDPAKFRATTARAAELIQLEKLVAILKTPQWPQQVLGEINAEKADQGRVLYEEFRGDEPSCAYCHALKDANGNYPLTPAEENLFGAQFVVTEMTPLAEIGTDPISALNFASRVVSTGHLAAILPEPFTGAAELPAPVLLSILVGAATQSSIAMVQPPLSQPEVASAIGFRLKAEGLPLYRPKNLLAYRARPLDGIWATAPYLHNGSVQNLAELLKPGSERKTAFFVGSRKFDAKRVGFKSKENKTTSLLDTTIPSNSNQGHEYGVTLTKKEKWALIEFLKTL